MTQPFEGVKVIDCTHVLAGPFSTYQLAVFGADVIHVENPLSLDHIRLAGMDRDLNEAGMGTVFQAQNSNKRFITVNLKEREGQDLLREMVREADIFVENFRPGAMKNLDLDYASLSSVNPRLIYCSISAYGQTGPRASQTAYDSIIQASSGLMHIAGTPDTSPIKLGPPAVDYAAGLAAAFALASALFQREKTGRGQYIDVSMLDAAMFLNAPNVTDCLHTGIEPKPIGNGNVLATGGVYPTRDGQLMIGALSPRQQRRLWTVLDCEWFIPNEEHASRSGREEEAAVLAEKLLERDAESWENFFQERHIPAARVRNLTEALADPHLEHRDLLKAYPSPDGHEALTVPVSAFKLEHGGASLTRAPARPGADTEEVLGEFGFSKHHIADLKARRIV